MMPNVFLSRKTTLGTGKLLCPKFNYGSAMGDYGKTLSSKSTFILA